MARNGWRSWLVRRWRAAALAVGAFGISGCAPWLPLFSTNRPAARIVDVHMVERVSSAKGCDVVLLKPTPRVGPQPASAPGSGEVRQAAYRAEGDAAAPAPPRPETKKPAEERYPIDLCTVLRLAGANNLQIALAAERHRAAQARSGESDSQWLPDLTAWAGDKGAVLLAKLPLIDALPPQPQQDRAVRAAEAARNAAFNDTLLQSALAHTDLLQAYARLSVALDALKQSEELARLVEGRGASGPDAATGGLRMQGEVAERKRQALQAEEAARLASAELARLCCLDPSVTLVPAEERPAPMLLVGADFPLGKLIVQAIANRPEVARQEALAAAARRAPDSQARQAEIAAAQLRDRIAADVSTAYHQAKCRKKQIDVTIDQVQAATGALSLTFAGVRDGTLRVAEGRQAVQALADARARLADAILDHNRAQFRLLHALGHAPDPVTAGCDCSARGSPLPVLPSPVSEPEPVRIDPEVRPASAVRFEDLLNQPGLRSSPALRNPSGDPR